MSTEPRVLRYTAFADDPSGGNPAGIVLDASGLDDAAMQAIATEVDYAETAFVTGREGKPGARKADEIGVLAMRGGDVIGDHTVLLLGDGERIELTHRASNRDLFARGALRAGKWLVGRAAGRYELADVLR